jgi:hypothetical protein
MGSRAIAEEDEDVVAREKRSESTPNVPVGDAMRSLTQAVQLGVEVVVGHCHLLGFHLFIDAADALRS